MIIKKYIYNSFLICFSTLSGLIISEFLIRFIVPSFNTADKVKFENDIGGVVIGMPNTTHRQWNTKGEYDIKIRFNSSGLRDLYTPENAKEEDYIIVGDSFTFGQGLEEHQRFSNILRSRYKIFNVNIGMSGTDFNGYEILLDYAKKERSKSSKIIVAICMENDLKNYSEIKYMKKPEEKILLITRIKRFLSFNSSLYMYLATVIQQNDQLKNFFVSLRLLSDSKKPSHLELLEEDLNFVKDSSEKLFEVIKNYESIVVIIPSRGLWIGNTNRKKFINKVHNNFVNVLRKNKIEVIDMKPFLEREKEPLKYFFKTDGHLNEKGNNLIAESIANRLGSQINIINSF